MKSRKLGVALISAGMITNMAHIPAFKCISNKVELLAVSDLNEDVAAATAKRHGIPQYYTDTERMLRETKPDLVSICTPNVSHRALVELALNMGCNVACEKPMAMTYKDTKAMFDLAKAKGLKIFACQTMRYYNNHMVAKEMMDTGVLGDVYYSEFNFVRRRGIPKWGQFHLKEHNGGGAFCDLGVHMVDSALWIMGNPKPVSVTGITSDRIARSETNIITSLAESGATAGVHTVRGYSPEEFGVDEFAAGTIRLEGNRLLSFKVSWAVNLPELYNMTLAGDKAGVTLPDLQLYSTMGRYQVDIKPRVFNEGKHDSKDFKGHYYLFENAVNSLLGKEELIVKPEETLDVAAIIDAFYVSAREGREVLVSEVK